MCVQCAATATVVVGSASGLRAWLGARAHTDSARRRLRLLTIALASAAVVVSGIGLSGA